MAPNANWSAPFAELDRAIQRGGASSPVRWPSVIGTGGKPVEKLGDSHR
ncbi:MAG: hypothetical protein ACUVYA_06615 [Planctomycetota bacterium]